MSTAFFFHDQFLRHDAGWMHPENAQRLESICRGMKKYGLWDTLLHPVPEPATDEQVLLVHTKAHLDAIRSYARRGSIQIDSDTHVSSESFDAAMLAAGAAVQAVQGILDGSFDNAFAAVRPPGHHATTDRAMGFCLFNNVAIAARYLTRYCGLKRVLIMDWDVHHGNGTQDIFYSDSSVVYVSLHRAHHYPGTGWEDERGYGSAEGTKINVPVSPPFAPLHYEALFKKALAASERFAPEFILISCGFDAHERDPLGNLGLKDETYANLTRLLVEFADQFGHRRIFSILEGGYDSTALAEASAAHVAYLIEAGRYRAPQIK